MVIKSIIKEIILTYQNRDYSDAKDRDLNIDFSKNKIISIIWPRRSWKSYFLFNLIQKLKNEWIEKNDFLYINFEDERLDIKWSDLGVIIDSYRELYPLKNIEDSYLFFDEIQNIDWWEKFVRRINDEWFKNIYITWSNAKLLSKEISTSLRWRSISFEILPLDFKEYLFFKGIEIDNINKKEDKALVLLYFDIYLKWWGFPEIIDYSEELKVKVLQEYFDVMIYNDIIERYKVKDVSLLKIFIKKLLQTTTKDFSINKISNELKSMWFKFDKNIVYDYIDYLETIYFWKVIQKFDFSIKKQFLVKKFYSIDNGFLNALTFSFSDNHWKLLENLVFMFLYKKYWENIYFIKEQKLDLDFIVNLKENIIFQVCYNLTDDNRKREIWNLEMAMNEYKVDNWFIITRDQFKVMDNWIIIKPFYSLFDF